MKPPQYSTEAKPKTAYNIITIMLRTALTILHTLAVSEADLASAYRPCIHNEFTELDLMMQKIASGQQQKRPSILHTK